MGITICRLEVAPELVGVTVGFSSDESPPDLSVDLVLCVAVGVTSVVLYTLCRIFKKVLLLN